MGLLHQRSTPPPRRWGASLVDRVCFGERTPSAAAEPNGRIAMIALRRCVNPPIPGGMNVRSEHLKKFANLSPHISVQIPLWSTSRQCLHPLPDRKKAEPSRVPRWEGSDCFLWILFEKAWFYPVFAPFWHFGSVTKKSRNADIFRILVGRELMSSDF